MSYLRAIIERARHDSAPYESEIFCIVAGSQIKICDDPVFFNLQLTNFFWDDAAGEDDAEGGVDTADRDDVAGGDEV